MSVTKQSFFFVDSNPNTDFATTASTQTSAGASTFANIKIDSAVSGGQAKCFVNTIRIISMQQCDYRMEFYDRGTNQPYGVLGAAPVGGGVSGSQISATTFALIGYVDFYNWATASTANVPTVGEPTRVATGYATMFVYFASGLQIPIVDNDSQRGGGEIHANLVVNSNVASRLAGLAGGVAVRFGVINAA